MQKVGNRYSKMLKIVFKVPVIFNNKKFVFFAIELIKIYLSAAFLIIVKKLKSLHPTPHPPKNPLGLLDTKVCHPPTRHGDNWYQFQI